MHTSHKHTTLLYTFSLRLLENDHLRDSCPEVTCNYKNHIYSSLAETNERNIYKAFSRTVSVLIFKDGKTSELHLQIDIYSMKESYSNGEVACITWIPGRMSTADALTEAMLTTTSPLWMTMANNKMDPQPIAWVSTSSPAQTTVLKNIIYTNQQTHGHRHKEQPSREHQNNRDENPKNPNDTGERN